MKKKSNVERKSPRPKKAASWALAVGAGSDKSPTLSDIISAATKSGAKVTCSLVPKPPLGLRPRWLAKEMRMQEIAAACIRYMDDGKPVPAPWTEELAHLVCNAEHRRAWIHRDTFNPNK